MKVLKGKLFYENIMKVGSEKNAKDLWGRIENKPQFFPTTVAHTVRGVLNNLRTLIKDYLKHEGKQDKTWKKIDPRKIEFKIHYDVQAFFVEFGELKISSIAETGQNIFLGIKKWSTSR